MPPLTPVPAAPPVAAAPSAQPVPSTPPVATAPAPAPTPPVVAAIPPSAPTAAPPAPSAPQPAPAPRSVDSPLIAALIKRGSDTLATGDVSAARLLFERAANLGSGAAALALGRAFDPGVLSRLGTVGLRGDPALAARWYRIAAERGETEADGLLAGLGTSRAN